MAQFLDLDGLKTYNDNVVVAKYYTKTSGEADRTDIDVILKGDKALVTPTIVKNNWGATNKAGQAIAIAGLPSMSNCDAPVGATVTYSGVWKWVHDDSKKDPKTVTGQWGTALPASNTESAQCAVQTKTSDTVGNFTIATVTLSAPRAGLMLKDQKIIKSEGNDSTSASAVVSFKDNIYYGPVTTANPSAGTIASLNSVLLNTKSTTVTATTTTSQYYCYAYPKSYGELSTIVMDGADSIKDNFRAVQTVSVTNKAGLTKDYYVYVSVNQGAFSKNSLAFK